MFKVISIFSLVINMLFALEIEDTKIFYNLLPYSQIYIDKNNSLSIRDIEKKYFLENSKESLGFGYSPNFTVWIKFTLENYSSKKMDRVIEYANPLTTDVTFFEPRLNRIEKEGLFYINKKRGSLHPTFLITLEPYSFKTIYIRAYTYITTLRVDVYLWSIADFYRNEIRYQFVLAIFFGAMAIIIFYNLIIYIGTKEIIFLYYVLFFISIVIHQILYRGIAGLYILSPTLIEYTVEFSSFFVAIPAFFLALFTKEVLELNQYPKIDKFLNYYLIIFPILVIIIFEIELHRYKNLWSILLLILLFFIIIYALWKRNRQAYFLAVGWILLILSGLLMYLSSLGIFDIFHYIPYYSEVSLILESLIFSLLLADKIRELQKKKIVLEDSLVEKGLLLKELNHRVQNSIQTIVSFLRLQIDEIEEKKTQQILMNIENRIMSISHLYNLLYTKDKISFINTYEYFSVLIEEIQISYAMPHIKIEIEIEVNINSEHAIYCGFILNEVITNSLQHGFLNREQGYIYINLKKEEGFYKLFLSDNGIGYEKKLNEKSLGLIIIETLVLTQLKGISKIDSKRGVEITIEWKDNE